MKLVVTLLGPDQPGIVKAFSRTVAEAGGSWCESRVLQAHGQFGGVFMADVSDERADELENTLHERFRERFRVSVVHAEPKPDRAPLNPLRIRVSCADRPGLLHEFSEICGERNINILELNTNLSPAAMSGVFVFEIEAVGDVPEQCDRNDLARALEALGHDALVELSDRNLKQRYAHLF